MAVKLLTQPEDPNPERHHSTFAELVAGREAQYPVLARATGLSAPANRTVVEWPVGDEVWKNYTQITRYPYTDAVEEGSSNRGGSPNAVEALDRFLSSVENTLTDGVPSASNIRGLPVRSCGGYRHYLGRELVSEDRVILRPLREPFLWERRWRSTTPLDLDVERREWIKLDEPEFEWLAEFCLQVIPGE